MVSEKKYSLLLISPKAKYSHYAVQNELAQFLHKKKSMVSLALPLIAGLTPHHYSITIIDEDIEPFPKTLKPDLVGVTSTAATIERAYYLADYFSEMGATVVMGGPSASFMVEESLKHAHSVVIGEAEGVWEQFLRDFENNKIKKTYKAAVPVDFKTSVFPRWDLLDNTKTMALPVEISRGCPYNCEFCVVTKMYGHKQRYRNIDDVINEVSRLPSKRFLIVDDNLTFNKQYCIELAKRLKPLNLNWVCQGSLEIAENDELLRALSVGGCTSIVMGFESLNPASLSETKKHHNNVEYYERVIKKINSFGIHVAASFVVGFDHDTHEDFDRVGDFIIKNNLAFSMISLLSAPEGSDLFIRLQKDGRFLGKKFEYRCGVFPAIKYKNFTTEEIFDKYWETSRRIKSFDNLSEMARRLFSNGAFVTQKNHEVTVATKIGTSFSLIKYYLFSGDKSKRKLFNTMISYAKNKIAGQTETVVFLLTMAAFGRYFERNKKVIGKIRQEFFAS